MKAHLMFFLRKTQFALMAALGILPLALVLCAFLAGRLLPSFWLLVLLFLVLSVSAMRIPGKLRIWIGIAEAAIMVLLWVWLHPGERQWVAGLSAGIYALMLLWSLQFGGMGQDDELPVYVTWVGAALHVAAQMLAMADLAWMKPVTPWLTAAMVVFLLLAVLAANRRSLVKASTGRQEVPIAMRRRNLWMTLGVFALAVALSFSSLVSSGVRAGLAWIIQLLMYLAFGAEDLVPDPTEPTESVPPATEDLGQLGPAPQIRVDQWFYTFAQVVAIACLAVFAYLAIRRLLRKWPGIKAALNRHFSASGEDYVDEVSSTREGGFVDSLRLRKKRERTVSERSLPPRQRVRARYRKLMKKSGWAPGSTPRENLPEEMASVYERARYSPHAVSEEEAEAFRQRGKKL